MSINIGGFPFEQRTSLEELDGKAGVFAVLAVKDGVGTILSLGVGENMKEEIAKPEHANALTSRPMEELALVANETGDGSETDRNAMALAIKSKLGMAG